SWSASPNLKIISSSNSSVTVQKINSTIIGNGFVEAALPGKTLRKDISIQKKPEISFPYNDLTAFLLGRSNTINNINHYVISNGSKIPFKIGGSTYTNLSWKNTKYYRIPKVPPDQNKPIGKILRNGKYVNLYRPYVPDIRIPSPVNCFVNDEDPGDIIEVFDGTIKVPKVRSSDNHKSSLVGKYKLIDYHFQIKAIPDEQVEILIDHNFSPYFSPSITIPQGNRGLLEVEVAAVNKCGCDSKANAYIVLPPDTGGNQFKSLFSMSPNPASNLVNIKVRVPKRELMKIENKETEKIILIIDPETRETYLLPPERRVELEPILPGVSPLDPPKSKREPYHKEFSYELSIYNLITGVSVYREVFKLSDSDRDRRSSKVTRRKRQTLLNTTDYPTGIYVVRLNSLTEKAIIYKNLIISH
ncbi:MAG: hypothetical protein ACWIPI_01490, partial [Polaribacter sp.]